MIGCELCQATVKDYDASEIKDDEVCLACDQPLGEVKADQDNKNRQSVFFKALVADKK